MSPDDAFDKPTPPEERPALAEIQRQARGLNGPECPDCGCHDFHVLRTGRWIDNKLHRTRICRYCGYPMGTEEKPVDL